MFQVMRRLHLPESDMEQLYRRMVFNAVARNHDDHTKNHVFIMDQSGKWELAPAFDLVYSYRPSGKWTNEHQLSVNNKRDHFKYSDFIAVGDNMGSRQAEEIITQVTEVVAMWPAYARKAGVKKEFTREIAANLMIIKK
jgi:serine/threonine-protein kinase HipA